MKKTFRIRVRINNCTLVFKDELGEGVLGSQDFVFDLDEKDYESPLFTKTLLDESEALINDLIRREVMEVKDE